jgi:predicted  nucleic acid-binding Zn-ribbon protein
VMAQNAEVARLQAGVRDRQSEIERIEKDQTRVRENLAALKTSAEERQLVARYATQLNTQEDRLAVLRKEIEDLEQQRSKAQAELVRLANAVTLDVAMP